MADRGLAELNRFIDEEYDRNTEAKAIFLGFKVKIEAALDSYLCALAPILGGLVLRAASSPNLYSNLMTRASKLKPYDPIVLACASVHSIRSFDPRRHGWRRDLSSGVSQTARLRRNGGSSPKFDSSTLPLLPWIYLFSLNNTLSIPEEESSGSQQHIGAQASLPPQAMMEPWPYLHSKREMGLQSQTQASLV